MIEPLCKSKAARDRKRQRVGESRKQQIKVVRRQVKRWKDGATAADCMAEIATAIAKVGEHD